MKRIKTLQQTEEIFDDQCVKFIIARDRLGVVKINVIDNAIYVNKQHVASIMKRHIDHQEYKTYTAIISDSLTMPIKEMFILKQHYRMMSDVRFFTTWLWFLSTVILSCVLGFILLS